ncbi:ABC1 kinase family protein [Brevibacterium linens]|uniref:Ubiquinone biosynthesis protein n=1 Tax=Brevibacterium linens TaxID=1703 RepID=A0A2H1ITL4_BRELN|nr:AarF/UbiB family protein [Brevibacterium linens]SMX78488.1 ubiquinone biosynthesis protein [Brevibacterium linens]
MEALDVGGYALVSLAALVFLFLQSWFAATVVRRVVGVPTGWPRTLAVGLVMSAVVAVTVQYLYRAGTGQNVDGLDVSPGVAVLFMVLALGWIFALGVGALVMLEAAFPTGSLPSPQSLFFGWRSRRRRARRYAQVVSIAVRHGLGSQLRGFGGDSPGREVKTARALKESLAEAGVTFVKLGQMLSTRRDILPPVFVRELETLQTQVTPEPWSVIEPAIAERLGRPIGEVFARIDSTPLAAASVAQVHEATLLDGTEVIVKVQRPKALNQVAQDLDIILRLAGWLNKTTTWGRDLGVQSLAAGFANTLEEELDYRIELDNMASIEASLTRSGKFDVTVPHGYPGLSGERLLVMDRLPGQPVSRAGALLTGLSDAERSRLATTLLGATLEQIIGDGIFHADLHAGNIFITPERKLGLLDFGAVGRLDPATQTSLGLMLYSIDQNDSAGATDALIELLGRPDGLDDREVERAVGELLLRYGGGTRATQGQKLFDDLFNLVLAHRFSVPAPISAAFRAMASVEGALLTIDPNFDVVAVSRKEGNRLVRSKLKGTKITDELQRRALQLMPMIDRMPRRINKITEDLEQGRFSMNMRVLENPSDRSFLTSLFQQLIVAVLAGAAVVGAIMLITSDEGPLLTKDIHLYSFFGFVLLFGGFVLSMRSLMLVFRRDGQG